MPLPTSRELREMLDEATPGPWGFDQLAPQLAEEVIRLREEIDRPKWHCLDSVQVAEAEVRLADGEREKARQEGRAEAYYSTYLQITQEQHEENK